MDPLANYFPSLFEESHLIDVVPNFVSPTWSNGKVGKECLAKRLNIILWCRIFKLFLVYTDHGLLRQDFLTIRLLFWRLILVR